MLICDEPVSSLDLSVQSQILNLLNDLKNNLNLTIIFVSHDLSVVKNISDEVMVLKEGKMIEYGQVNNIFNSPQNIYTKELISSVPSPIPV
jgi:ABC-type oligopeptide transport system ATPase subunit